MSLKGDETNVAELCYMVVKLELLTGFRERCNEYTGQTEEKKKTNKQTNEDFLREVY